MQFYLVVGLVCDLVVFHLLPHGHDAIPEGGIYVILDRTWGGWGAARGTVERGQVSSSFQMVWYNSLVSISLAKR